MLWKAKQLARLKVPGSALARIAVSAITMAAVAGAAGSLRPALGLPLGIALGTVVFGLMLRAMHALDQTDVQRLYTLTSRLPLKLQTYCNLWIAFLGGWSTQIPVV